MEDASTENAKISDSGYSNTCSNCQSQRSSEALPQPIKKHNEHKKKQRKSKTCSVSKSEVRLTSTNTANIPNILLAPANTKSLPRVKPEEVAILESVGATDTGNLSGDLVFESEAGLGSLTSPPDDFISNANEQFWALVSMQEGSVLYATPSLCKALGYPEDAWTGKSFIEFVHPNDKDVFVKHLASELAAFQHHPSGAKREKASILTRLRRCSLKLSTNYSPPRISTVQGQQRGAYLYIPHRLSVAFRKIHVQADQRPRVMLLIITVNPIRSAYKVPEETILPSIFSTSHTATCLISHVDPEVVQYFGYLPHDMIGRSVFDFYHPEDLPLIKDIYETVIELESSFFKSKPYRFIVQNGSYVVLETEWSTFISPWTKKLEFVLCKHRVLKGPADSDVFRTPDEPKSCLANVSEEVLNEAKLIKAEIQNLLGERAKLKSLDTSADVTNRSNKVIASYMKNILKEIKKPANATNEPATDKGGISGHMIGEISPHHEFYGSSKSSTETPLSYNQLNYHENLERFFNSKPEVRTAYSSDEDNVNSALPSKDVVDKNNATTTERNGTSSIMGSGDSGTISGSAENSSGNSKNEQTSNSTSNPTTTTATNSEQHKSRTLTESILNKHNEDMEKQMVQKYRKLRKFKKSPLIKNDKMKVLLPENERFANYKPHGLKRRASYALEGDSFKISRHDDAALARPTVTSLSTNINPAITRMTVDHSTPIVQTDPNMNIWSPLSVTVPSGTLVAPNEITAANTATQAALRIPAIPQMIPIYYFPVPKARETTEAPKHTELPNPSCSVMQQAPPSSYVATTVSGVLYPPIIAATSPAAMMYRPFVVPETASLIPQPPIPTTSQTSVWNRPASQATSVKGEPGSVMGMSESSKKVFSRGQVVLSCVENDDECFSLVNEPMATDVKDDLDSEGKGDDSNSSSFFSTSVNDRHGSSFNTSQKQDAYRPNNFSKEMSTQQQRYNNKQYHQFRTSVVRKEPSWLEGVHLTPKIIYEYQIRQRSLSEVIQADMNTLKHWKQPVLVNDQLGQLYLDLELEGFDRKLILDEGLPNSDGASDTSSNVEDHSLRRSSRMGAW